MTPEPDLTLRGNRFENNLTQVAVSAVGDTSHEIWLYSDRIWMETPKAKFFGNAPALELLDFLERLAPFASPSLILRAPNNALDAAQSSQSGGLHLDTSSSRRSVTALPFASVALCSLPGMTRAAGTSPLVVISAMIASLLRVASVSNACCGTGCSAIILSTRS